MKAAIKIATLILLLATTNYVSAGHANSVMSRVRYHRRQVDPELINNTRRKTTVFAQNDKTIEQIFPKSVPL